MKKEFIGPGLHLRPICADHARLPLQWTLNSLLSAYGNDKGRIRPPLGRGILEITHPGYSLPKRKHTVIIPVSGQVINFFHIYQDVITGLSIINWLERDHKLIDY